MKTEFLQTLESFKVESENLTKVFNSGAIFKESKDGARVRSNKKKQNPKYMGLLVEAAEFMKEVLDGKRPAHQLAEAMTTSDFPVLFGDILDRQILANYREYEPTWQQYVRRRTVRDFRPIEYRMWPDEAGGASSRLEIVHEQEEYPETDLPDISKIQYRINKYGRRLPFSWEALVNDDVELFASIPERFARAARRTEQRFAVEMFVSATGPVAPFFSVANGNLINRALSVQGIQEGLSKFADMVDDDGEPIVVEAAMLVVPRSLEVIANTILNATEIRMRGAVLGGNDVGNAGGEIVAGNWLRGKVRVVVDPYLSIINQTNGSTAWYLIADPNEGRPAFEMAFLRGHEDPAVFVKDPNARRVGGGQVNPEDGDFDTDSIEYKIRHVLGGSRVEPKAAVASTGTQAAA